MKVLLDDIIAFIDGKFAAESDFTNKPQGHYAYEQNLIPTGVFPYYEIQVIGGNDRAEEFNRLVSRVLDLQINVYGVKAKVKTKLQSPQAVSMILADKCEEFMQEFKYANGAVLSLSEITRSPTLPYKDGAKSYTTALRYRIEIALPYKSIKGE